MTVRPFVVAAMLIGACSAGETQLGGGRPAYSDFASPVAMTASVAEPLLQDPARADEILAAHGLTTAALDEILYQVAADSILSDAYTQAR